MLTNNAPLIHKKALLIFYLMLFLCTNIIKKIFMNLVKIHIRIPVGFLLYKILENVNYNVYLEMATWVGFVLMETL